MNILDAELVSIDKEQQCVVLPDQRKVLYGLLLLAVGLEEASLLPKGRHQIDDTVVSARQLLRNLPQVC